MLHRQVKDRLLQRIRGGEFAVGDRLPTQGELATEFGVSSGTVSKAIHELCSEGVVESRTRDGVRVLPAASDRPHGPVGLVIRGVTDATGGPFESLMGTLSRLITHGPDHQDELALIPALGRDGRGEFIPLEDLSQRSLSGLLVMNVMDITWLANLKMLGTPVVVLDRDTEQLGLDCVVFDNVGAAFDLTRSLIERGHRRIAFFGKSLPTSRKSQRDYDPATYERFQGYRMALRAAGIADDPALVFYHRGDALIQASELLDAHGDVTAVLTEFGVGDGGSGRPDAIREVLDRGLAVAGWRAWGERTRKRDRFTVSVDFDLQRMGEAAVQLLRRRMAGEGGLPQRILLDGTLSA